MTFRQHVRTTLFAGLFCFALLGLAGAVLAQDPSPPPVPVDQIVELGVSIAGALIIFGTPLATLAIKKAIPSLPKWSIPIVASIVGVVIQFLTTLGPQGGKWAPVATVFIVGIVNLLRGVLANFGEGKASQAMAILLCFSLGLSGCASGGSIQHAAAISIKTAGAALALADEVEYASQCSAPTAPPAGYCVSPGLHRELSKKFIVGFGYVEKAGELYLAWDQACGEATARGEVCKPAPTEIAALALKVAAIVREIIAGMPDSKPKGQLLKQEQVVAVHRVALSY